MISKKSNFMLVNIAWNHSGWRRLEPNPSVGFGYTKRPGKSAYSPHESLNFDFFKKDIDTDDYVYGYFQTRGTPRHFNRGGIVIFWSLNTDDKKGYFVGVYGNAEILEDIINKDNKIKRDHPGFEAGKFWSNIRGFKRLSCLFPCPIEDSAYKIDGKRLIGRTNFTYNFDKKRTLKLIQDAINVQYKGTRDPNPIEKLTVIRDYVENYL